MTRMRVSRVTGVLERGKQDRETVANAVELARRLGTVLPGLDPTVAGLLRLLARRLSEQRQYEQALAAAEEAVALCRRETATRRARFDLQLVWALIVRADIQDDLGRGHQAAAAGREAVALCRYRLPDDPRRFGPALLAALDIVARSLNAADQPHEALPFGEEHARILRRLASRRPQYNLALAAALHQLSVYSAGTGENANALRAIDESIRLYEGLQDREPGSATMQLATATENRELFLDRLARSGHVVLGPYPLCAMCEQTNGGLIAVEHRQLHVRAAGRESCVDHRLSEIIPALWNRGCDTRSSCQDANGAAMVVPVAGQADLAVHILSDLGIHAYSLDGEVYFPLPPAP
ncbi:hypothetical protein AB0L82_14095 [Nocardia sp. NPDC052001]|uniref:hypothetical protein n=1 Tax=Nocardia sp. NPDC052001 TaxID=3154853 RepID=UPI00343BC5E2